MTYKEDETLEEYIERLHYNLQGSPYATLLKEVLKTVIIRGMQDEWLETLNLIWQGDISKEECDDIVKLCIRWSRGSVMSKKRVQEDTGIRERRRVVVHVFCGVGAFSSRIPLMRKYLLSACTHRHGPWTPLSPNALPGYRHPHRNSTNGMANTIQTVR